MKKILNGFFVVILILFNQCTKDGQDNKSINYGILKLDNMELVIDSWIILPTISYGSSTTVYQLEISGYSKSNENNKWDANLSLHSETVILSEGNYNYYGGSYNEDSVFFYYDSTYVFTSSFITFLNTKNSDAINGGNILVERNQDSLFFNFNVLVDSAESLTGKFRIKESH